MNRTIADATVRRYRDDRHDRLRLHRADVHAARSFAHGPEPLGGLPP